VSKLIENVKAARRSGVPLLAIASHDQPATVDSIDAGINGCPKVAWDCVNGLRALNPEGKTALTALGDQTRDSFRALLALKAIQKIQAKTVVFLYNAAPWLREPPVAQAVQNLRETFKENQRTLILLDTAFAEMGASLKADVVQLEESLPTEEQLGAMLKDMHDSAGSPAPTAEKLPAMIDAVRGLPSLFQAEQVTAMSFRKKVLDQDVLWERKESTINSTAGLTISRGGLTFADLAGMNTIMEFLRKHQAGPSPFRLILFWDEIEKMMAGAGGDSQDSSGVSSDFLGVCLKKMEDLGWAGIILFGVPGSGKTALAQATSGEFGVPMISMDFGAFKGRFVGDSESAVRTGFGTVESLGGENVLVVATCNRMKSLPPEFRRRFWLGNWYYDVPSLPEQEPIKRIYEKKYGIENAEWPNTEGWTGAEIRNAARLTHRLQCSLAEACNYVVPITRADPESLEQLRAVADGRFLSVSSDGVWTADGGPQVVGKKAKRAIGAN